MKISNLSIFSFIKSNLLCRSVKRQKHAFVIPFGKSILSLKGTLNLNNTLLINTSKETNNQTGRSSIVRVDQGGTLNINGKFNMYYSSDVIVFPGGSLTLDGGFINSNVTLRCKSQIRIGKEAAISHGVLIQDYDGHELFFDDDTSGIEKKPDSAPITIGKHVLVFANTTILKGVSIGNGAIIAAGSVVTEDIPAHSMAAGVPARVIKNNVRWK